MGPPLQRDKGSEYHWSFLFIGDLQHNLRSCNARKFVSLALTVTTDHKVELLFLLRSFC
jgi:hypothetical protein